MTVDRRRKRRVRARAAKTGESYTAALRHLRRTEECTMSTFTIDPAGITDTGHVRQANEDHYLTGGDLFAVADGMGGTGQGEIASRLAIETLRRAFADDPTATGLVEAVRRANAALIERARTGDGGTTFGTTIAAVARVGDDEDRLVVVNVGDTRVYLFRDGQLGQLSADHSRVADLVRAGEITAEQAAEHPERHVLTVALGIERSVAPNVNHVKPLAGDRVLLCSDGLFNDLPSDAIVATLARRRPAGPTAESLVAQAKGNGGADNITVVVLDIA